ncbi:MAG: transposase [Bacteroidota bacterium]
MCEAEGIEIMKGVVSSDHIHMNVEYAPKTNVSYMIKQ